MTRSVITQRKMEIPTGVLIKGLQLLLVMRVNKSIMTSPIDVTMTPVDSGLVIQCVRPERDGLLTPVVPRYPLGRWIHTVVTSRWLSSSQTVRMSWCPPEARPFRSGIDYSAPPTERTSVPGCIRQRQAVVRLSRRGVSNGRARRALRAGLLAGYVVIKLGGASSSFGHIILIAGQPARRRMNTGQMRRTAMEWDRAPNPTPDSKSVGRGTTAPLCP